MNKTNRQDMRQKTDFNNWSISYLRDIYQCCKCKKRNTILLTSTTTTTANNTNQNGAKLFQNCLYCGNPNYV
jgi:hypothetical protein